MLLRAPISISAADLKAGDVMDFESTLLRVESTSTSRQGQTRPVVQLSVRNLKTGAKKDMRLRVDDAVEKAEMELAKHQQVLYVEGDKLSLMDGASFEQMEIASALLGERAPFIREGMQITVESYKGVPLAVTTPEKAEVAVAEVAEPPAQGRAEKGFDLDAVLENGQRIKVPKYTKPGDTIVVSLAEGKVGTYMGRAEKK
jgi:elongation factor P